MSGRSSENEGLSQVVISASALASFFLKAGVIVRALSLRQRNEADNRLCWAGEKKELNKSRPAQIMRFGRGMRA